MSLQRTVLLVSPTPLLSDAVAPSLRRTGYRLMVVTTYQSAKLQLANAPQVLVTELKLGEYNGLQLALRSRTAGIRTIVVADKAFETDVEQAGAMWMSPEDAAGGELPGVICRLLEAPDAAAATSEWYDSSADATELLIDFPSDRALVIH